MKKEVILDSNIFIRFFIKDIKDQFEKATDIFNQIEEDKIKGFISILVVNEVIWILENFYELKKAIYLPQLIKILSLRNIKVMEVKKKILLSILERMRLTSYDFTDIYLFAIKEYKEILSFDRDFVKILPIK